MNFRYRPPLVVQKLFGDFIWRSTNNKILLTFDDGPTESATLKILSVLRSNQIKSVFFCVGNNIKQNPELAEKILGDGHTIANHTMNHKLLTKVNRVESIDEISSFNILMKEQFNYDTKFFRPAHGKFNFRTNSILNELNLKCVMWNLLTYDYENRIETVKYALDKFLSNNSIIVFHDNNKCSEIIQDSLEYAIEKAAKEGYQFGEPEDCLK